MISLLSRAIVSFFGFALAAGFFVKTNLPFAVPLASALAALALAGSLGTLALSLVDWPPQI